MEASIAHLAIDVDLCSHPIEGRLTADGAAAKPFTGYMQLVTMLEGALRHARSAQRAGDIQAPSPGGRDCPRLVSAEEGMLP
jgi:hypothetical protein